MKRLGYVICMAASLIILLSIYQIKIHKEVQPSGAALQDAFSRSGAKVSNSGVLFVGKLPDELSDPAGVRQFVYSFADYLGMVTGKTVSERITSGDTVHTFELSGVSREGRNIRIDAQLDKSLTESDKRTITVDISQNLVASGLDEIRRDVSGILKKYKINPRVYSSITGTVDGRLDYARLDAIYRSVFDRLEAKKVEGIEDGSLISISAYSPFISDTIKLGKGRINLNLAVRYNSYEDKTYIWLASPVITTEY